MAVSDLGNDAYLNKINDEDIKDPNSIKVVKNCRLELDKDQVYVNINNTVKYQFPKNDFRAILEKLYME